MIISPIGLATRLRNVALSDPGTERKSMLFYVDGKEMRFVRFTSEARVMTMELTNDIDDVDERHSTTILKIST